MTRKVIYLVLPFLLFTFTSTANATTALTSPPKIPENMQTNSQQYEEINQQTTLKKQYQVIHEQNLNASSEAKMLREEFNQGLQKINDPKKKALVERIDARIAEVNKTQTLRYFEVLDRLQAFLDKITRSTTDQNVLINIAAAQSAITNARSAVTTQANKIYTMTITDDLTLRQNAGLIMSQFRQDLIAVYKLVIEAKQAVQNLHTEKVLIKKEATSSAGF